MEAAFFCGGRAMWDRGAEIFRKIYRKAAEVAKGRGEEK
jgi:hypothetical protein